MNKRSTADVGPVMREYFEAQERIIAPFAKIAQNAESILFSGKDRAPLKIMREHMHEVVDKIFDSMEEFPDARDPKVAPQIVCWLLGQSWSELKKDLKI